MPNPIKHPIIIAKCWKNSLHSSKTLLFVAPSSKLKSYLRLQIPSNTQKSLHNLVCMLSILINKLLKEYLDYFRRLHDVFNLNIVSTNKYMRFFFECYVFIIYFSLTLGRLDICRIFNSKFWRTPLWWEVIVHITNTQHYMLLAGIWNGRWL